MPHYADGVEVKVGDQVIGKLANTVGTRAGTVISITPGAETCNAMVAYVESVAIDGDPADEWSDLERKWVAGVVLGNGTAAAQKVPLMAVWREVSGHRQPLFRVVRGESHGLAGPSFALFECADYCATAELTKAIA